MRFLCGMFVFLSGLYICRVKIFCSPADPFSLLCPRSCLLGARSPPLLQGQPGPDVRSRVKCCRAQGPSTLSRRRELTKLTLPSPPQGCCHLWETMSFPDVAQLLSLCLASSPLLVCTQPLISSSSVPTRRSWPPQ